MARKFITQGILVDIDETLCWTVGHWIAEMIKKFGCPEDLSVKEIINKYQFVQNVPYWQSVKVNEWIEEQIHSNDLQLELPLIDEDVVNYLQLINRIIPVVGYITNRPLSIKSGTVGWLKKYDFPDLPIVFRPDSILHSDGYKWKAEYLMSAFPIIQGIIDDDSRIIEYIEDKYMGYIFLFNSRQYIGEKKNIHRSVTWGETYLNIAKVFL